MDFPSKFRKGFLLYITRVSTEGNVTCLATNETNPLEVRLKEFMQDIGVSRFIISFSF